MKTRQAICVALADFTSLPSTAAHADPRIMEATALAMAEMDAWAERVLVMPLFPEPQAGKNIPNDVRANYVAYIRISMAIQELEKVMVMDAVQHPKKNELVNALKVWANRAMKAAEPNGNTIYGTE